MSDHVLHENHGNGVDDPFDLIGAYVLDAVDDDDRRRVEQLLATDPEARAEAERLDAAADRLADAAAEGAAAPAELLSSILLKVAARPAGGAPGGSSTGAPEAPTAAPDVEPVIPPRATRPTPATAAAGAEVVPLDQARSRRHRGAWILSAAAVVLLVVVGGLVVANRSGDDAVPPEVAMEQMAREAAQAPGARTGELTDPDATMAVQVIVDPQGHAFLMAGVLPPLDDAHTYQLWAAEGDQMVSLGLLGSAPTMSVVGVDPAVTALALTVEPVGGSTGPTSAPMAQGTLSQA